ncbi:hypothetical protein [Stenotrophomonas phage CM2]
MKLPPEMKGRLRMMPFHVVNNEEEMLHWESYYLDLGMEGIILRDPNKPYKNGRVP